MPIIQSKQVSNSDYALTGPRVIWNGTDATMVEFTTFPPIFDHAITMTTLSYQNCVFENVAIPDHSFDLCVALRYFNFPNDTVSIGSYAFQSTSFSSITIPDTVMTTGNFIFHNSEIKYITQNGTNQILIDRHWGYMHYLEKIQARLVPGSEYSFNQMFNGCADLYLCDLKNLSMDTIPSDMFQSCSSLYWQNIFIDTSSLKDVLAQAFAYCNKMTFNILPPLLNVGDLAFLGCVGIAPVDFSQMQMIGSLAFSNTKSDMVNFSISSNWRYASDMDSHFDHPHAMLKAGMLTDGSEVSMESFPFRMQAGTTKVKVGLFVGFAPNSSYVGATKEIYLIDLDTEEMLNFISREKLDTIYQTYSFYTDISRKVKLVIKCFMTSPTWNGTGPSTEVVGYNYIFPTITVNNGAYQLCALNALKLSFLGGSAFRNGFITSADLTGSTVVSIPNYAFDSSNLESFVYTLPIGSIGDYAFRNTWLAEFITPSTIAPISIGSRAFANCSNLSKVRVGAVGSLQSYAFANAPLKTLDLRMADFATYGSFAFRNSFDQLESLVLRNVKQYEFFYQQVSASNLPIPNIAEIHVFDSDLRFPLSRSTATRQ